MPWRIDDAEAVIDLGCGTGVASRRIARPVGVFRARHGHRPQPVPHRRGQGARGRREPRGIDFRVGDTQSLDLGDGEFDAVVAHTVISHVDRPICHAGRSRPHRQAWRSIGIFDGDYASLTFGHPDPDQGKRDDEALIAALVTNPRVMRQMPVLVRDTGLELVACFPTSSPRWARPTSGCPRSRPSASSCPRRARMTAAEASAWADRLIQASESDVFFGASNYYGYVLRKPALA